MARVTYVKKARKDHPDHGIKKGESYYWWQFAFGPKMVSKTHPSRSQLTRSEFLGQVYEIEDRIQAFDSQCAPEDLISEAEEIIEEIRMLGSECEEKRSNMPEQLQDAPSGEMLQSRVDECESWADEMEGVELELEELEVIAINIDDEDEDLELVGDIDLAQAKRELAMDRQENNMLEAINQLQECTYNGE